MRTIGRPFECRIATSRSSNQLVRHSTRAWIASMPAAARCRSPNFDRGDRQVIQRSILEAGFSGREDVATATDGGEVDGAARKPWSMELAERAVAHQQTADTGRVSKHLVERDADKIGPHLAQAQAVRRHVRRRIEQHVPAAIVRAVDQVERMFDTSEVGLRGKRKQIRRTGVASPSKLSSAAESRRNSGHRERDVGIDAPAARENSRMPLTEL
jgi:hypothetical protein